MQAQFNERNKNLKDSVNTVVDKIDQVANKTQNYISENTQQVQSQKDTSSGLTMGLGQANLEQDSAEPDMSGNVADKSLMSSIRHDIDAMHSTNPEVSKDLSSKFEETFAHNALP